VSSAPDIAAVVELPSMTRFPPTLEPFASWSAARGLAGWLKSSRRREAASGQKRSQTRQ